MLSRHSTLVGVFTERVRAQRAVAELKCLGFGDDRVGVLSRDGGPSSDEAAAPAHTKAGEAAAIGAAAGAGAGALWALGVAAGVLPPIGPIVAGGLLGSVLASAAGGAAGVGVAGALVGLGVPEEEARFYEGEIQGGQTLVVVQPGGRYDEARSVFLRHGAYDIHTGNPAARA
jgi:hypothetical protein